MKFGFTRKVSISFLFVGILILSAYSIIKVVPIIKNEALHFQRYIPKVEKYVTKTYNKFQKEVKTRTGFEIGTKFLGDALNYGKMGTKVILLNVPNIVASIIEWIFLVPLFLFFFLKDASRFKCVILELTPNVIFERFYYLFYQFNKQLGDYIFAKFIEASIVGIIITSGLLVMNVRFALLLGLLAGVTNIIPYLGPLLGTIPAILIALAEYGASSELGAVVILYTVANAIDLAIVFPLLVSKIVDLHPLTVVISVILGSHYLGIIGMVISIPLAAAFKLLITEIYYGIYSTQAK